MTDHPCKGMTKNQIRTFERIAMGDDSMMDSRTAKVLLRHGLIEQYDGTIPLPRGQTSWMSVRVKRYRVPIWAHIQFCQWASEQEFLDD